MTTEKLLRVININDNSSEADFVILENIDKVFTPRAWDMSLIHVNLSSTLSFLFVLYNNEISSPEKANFKVYRPRSVSWPHADTDISVILANPDYESTVIVQ